MKIDTKKPIDPEDRPFWPVGPTGMSSAILPLTGKISQGVTVANKPQMKEKKDD